MILDSDGRTVTAVANISQPPPITYTFTGAGVNCTNGSASVTAGGGMGGYSYSWTPSGATSSALTNVTAGSYTLRITDITNCSQTVGIIIHSNSPTLTVTAPSTLCGFSYNTFTASGADNYLWSNNSTSSLSTYFINGTTAQYAATVSVSGTNAVSGCTASLTKTIQVYKPIVSISGPNIVCLYNTAVLNGSGPNLVWSGSVSAPSLAVLVSGSAIYSVVGTDAFGCKDTAYHTISAQYAPTLAVNSGSICQGQSIVLTVTAGAVPGGPVTLTVQSSNSFQSLPYGTVVVSPTASMQYSVSMGISNGCTSSVAISNITVSPKPVLTVPAPSVCPGIQPTVNPAGANTYTISSPALNQFIVVGTSTAGCRSDTTNVTAFVFPSPTVSANSGSICAGNVYTVNPTGAAFYTITGNSFTVSPAGTSTYVLTGASVQGCTANTAAFITVSVVPLPTITVNSGSICAGSVFSITPAGAANYSVNGGSFTVSPLINTSFSVTGSLNGCVASNTAVSNVMVMPSPVITVSGGTICAGDTFTILPSGASSYSVSGGSFTVQPVMNTQYTVTGSDAAGCQALIPAILTVTVNPLPAAAISGPAAACQGSSINLSASGALTYTWQTFTLTATTQTINPVLMGNTTFTLTGKDAFGCIKTVTASVSALPLPNLLASAVNPSVCPGQTTAINASGANTIIISGNIQNNQPFIPGSSGLYTVTGIAANSCSSAVTVPVTVNSAPTLSLAVPQRTAVCKNEEVILSVGGAATYTWNTGAQGPVLTFTATATGTYNVIGEDPNGCSGQLYFSFVVNECSGLSEESISGQVRLFSQPGLAEFELLLPEPAEINIYDLSGKLIFHRLHVITEKLSVQNLSSGIYLLEIRSARFQSCRKIVVQ
jgi:hypothetical protein